MPALAGSPFTTPLAKFGGGSPMARDSPGGCSLHFVSPVRLAGRQGLTLTRLVLVKGCAKARHDLANKLGMAVSTDLP